MSHSVSRRRTGTVVALAAALAAGTSGAPALAQQAPGPVELQVLGINDFHGHLEAAGVLGAAVDQLAADQPNTLFVSAGDSIGASPFVSSSQSDSPTVEILDAIGLDASAVGNHELDKGYADLTGRVADLADFPYLAANVEGGTPDLQESAVVSTPSGVTVGFVGVVTQQTATLVSPAGIEGITFTDPVAAANRVAAQLSDGDAANGEADVVVLLAHEGAAAPASDVSSCADLASSDDAFGRIVSGTSADVDAILGGHTHVTVDCELPAPGGGTRPVLEAAEYGEALARLTLTYDPSLGRVTAASGDVLPLDEDVYGTDPEIDELVAQAEARAAEIGEVVIGSIEQDITRARTASGSEDRGAESVLGNFIADVQLSAVNGADQPGGPAQIAFMNPGGLRADLRVDAQDADEAPGEVTYAEAAVVQPFANTLFTLTLTGAQIDQVLEEQFQPAGASRPFLALGVSEGVFFRVDPSAPEGERISELTLDGAPIVATRTYRVVTNSFLASGGDNFATLGEGADARDTGLTDLDVLVGYFNAATDGVVADTEPRRVDLARLAGATRLATAVEVSRASFAAGAAEAVVLSRSDDYADALAGTPLAAAVDAPLLLTASDELSGVTAAEIERVATATATIHVLGGTAAVSTDVEDELEDRGYTVERHAGDDRYATAVAIAEELGSPSTVLLATGQDFADGLAAGVAAGTVGGAVLLTAGDALPAVTAAYLDDHPGRHYAVGGPAVRAVPSAEELAGRTRYATAVAVAAQLFTRPTGFGLASGADFPDAMTAGPLLARRGLPLLLSTEDVLPEVTAAAIADVEDTVRTVRLFGGRDALATTLESAVVELLEQ